MLLAQREPSTLHPNLPLQAPLRPRSPPMSLGGSKGCWHHRARRAELHLPLCPDFTSFSSSPGRPWRLPPGRGEGEAPPLPPASPGQPASSPCPAMAPLPPPPLVHRRKSGAGQSTWGGLAEPLRPKGLLPPLWTRGALAACKRTHGLLPTAGKSQQIFVHWPHQNY